MAGRKASRNGSIKREWKYAVGLILAIFGGVFGGSFLGDWFVSFGGMTAITLLVGSGLLGAAMLVVGMQNTRYIWALFFGLFSLMMLVALDQTARRDILARVTELGDGVQVLPLLVSILFCAALVVVLCDLFSDPPYKLGWIFAILLVAFMVFPRVFRAVKAINVAADKTVSHTATAKVIDKRYEDQILVAGRYRVTHYRIYYIITAESDGVAQGTRFQVGWELYHALEPGDKVELLLHPGALGTPWMEVAMPE